MARGHTTIFDARKTAVALLLFVSVYAAAFTLWIPFALQQYLWLAPLAGGVTVVAPIVESPNVTTRVSAEAQRFRVAGEDPASGRTYRFTIDAHAFSHCVPVLLALVAAAPGLALAARARVALLALGPLFAINLVLLLCVVENGFLTVGGPGAPVMDRALAPIFGAGTDAAEAFFGQFVSVIVVFGASVTTVLQRQARSATGGPNAPCACGSGLKRKRCCGA